MNLLETHSDMSLGFYNIHEAIRNVEERIPREVEDLNNMNTPALIEGDLCSYVDTSGPRSDMLSSWVGCTLCAICETT